MIENFLQELGLSSNEAHIYMYLLTHGESIASVVAKRLNLKRSTVYTTLDTLEEKEFINRTEYNNVAHFNVVDPDELSYICENKVSKALELERKAKKLQKEFKSMQERGEQLKGLRKQGTISQVDINGKIKYLEGIEAVRDMMEESLEETPDDNTILCYGLCEYHSDLSPEDWVTYTNKRVQNGLHVLSIQPDTNVAKQYQKRDSAELRETRLVPNGEYNTNAEINIIGDLIVMTSIRGNTPVAFKVYNKELAHSLKNLFKLAWERSKQLEDDSAI